MERNVQIIPSRGIGGSYIDVVIACTALCVGVGRLAVVMLGRAAILLVKITCLVGDNACLVSAALTAQTVIEDDLAVIGAVALRDTELVDSLCTNFNSAFGIQICS